MTDAVTNEGAPDSGSMTDEQIAEAFPGQDVAQIRASLEKAEGKGTKVSPNADGGDAEGTTDNAGDAVVYPDYIPEKYRNGTVEEAHRAMAQGHSELESKLGQSNSNEDNSGSTDAGDADDNSQDNDGDNGDTKVHLAELEQEFVEDGKISDETYADAAKQGMSKADVDNYIAGQQALAQQLITRVHGVAGGEESYSKMLTWATNSWNDAEVEAFDKVMETGTEADITIAVRGLRATYEAENGKVPTLMTGAADKSTPGAGTYSSKAEMTADMKDPRYKSDPAFRAQVAKKLENFDW